MKIKNIMRKSFITMLVILITAILCSLIPPGVAAEQYKTVQGIVEENNLQLGYITLYNENGTGSGKTAASGSVSLRTYNYLDESEVSVLKNHKKADIEAVEAGDTAYLKIDSEGYVVSVSAVDNYYPMYGTVISKKSTEIAVRYDNGKQQLLTVSSKVVVIKNKKIDSIRSLKDGDRVKLLLISTSKGTVLKEITIESDVHFISNIYKGAAVEVNDAAFELSVLNMRVLKNDKWQYTGQKGFTELSLSDNCKFYYDGTEIDIEAAAKMLYDNQAYIAVEKDYGGEDKAVVVSFRNEDNYEALYNDVITDISSGSGSFGLDKEFEKVMYSDGSIIVKDKRLVTAGSLENEDKAVVVAERNYESGDITAGVVQVDASSELIDGTLYRARIKQINENSDFTVESYSELTGTDWSYSNTPKTFDISSSTRLLEDNGVKDMRKFVGYGTDSYIGKTVYIYAQDTDAIAISTAPFGAYMARGTVYGLKGAGYGAEGTLLSEPDELLLKDTSVYDETSCTWQDSKEMDISLPGNSLIFKNGKLAKPSDIEPGDTVRILEKEKTLGGTAYIVIVE